MLRFNHGSGPLLKFVFKLSGQKLYDIHVPTVKMEHVDSDVVTVKMERGSNVATT